MSIGTVPVILIYFNSLLGRAYAGRGSYTFRWVGGCEVDLEPEMLYYPDDGDRGCDRNGCHLGP